MRTLTCLTSIVGIALPAAAQFVPTATAGAVTVFASSATAAPVLSGTGVWAGFVRDANATTCGSHLGVVHTLTSAAVDLQWQLSSAASLSGVAATDAAVVYHFSSSAPIVGHFVVTWVSTANGHGSSACEIDLGNDGSIDATGSASLAVASAAGVEVLLRVHALTQANAGVLYGPWGTTWNYSGSAQASLHVRFEPTAANVQIVAPACGTASLTAATNLLEGVDFNASLPPANGLALLVLGLAPNGVPVSLPWSTCTLAVEPVVVSWQPVVAGVSDVWSLPVPAAVRPIALYGQLLGLDLDAPAVTASAALWVSLP